MAHFSLERVLSPVPTSAFATVSEIVSSIPSHLSPRFLQKALETQHQVPLSLKQVENVVYKCKTYLPFMVPVSHPLGQHPHQLKKYQEMAPGSPIVCVPPLMTACDCCGCALEEKAGKASSRLVNNLRGSDEIDNAFVIFTQAAGVLCAEFAEGFCAACRLYFTGCWQFEKKAGAFHHMDKLRCCGLRADMGVFVPGRCRACAPWCCMGHVLLVSSCEYTNYNHPDQRVALVCSGRPQISKLLRCRNRPAAFNYP